MHQSHRGPVLSGALLGPGLLAMAQRQSRAVLEVPDSENKSTSDPRQIHEARRDSNIRALARG